MGNKLKKQQQKLEERQKDYETVPSHERQSRAYTRPGSMNRHKQNTAGSSSRKFKR